MNNRSRIKRLLIYAHFNPLGRVSEHVFFTVEKCSGADIDILFMSTSPINSAEDRSRLLDSVSEIYCIDNIGYDFYAWKSGLERYANRLQDYDYLILLNSSVLGPVFDFSNFLLQLDELGDDMIGATSSRQRCYHIQSYFVFFTKKLFMSQCFTRFWRELVPVAVRTATIFQHELSMARFFQDCNYSVGAFWESADRLNPTIHHPDELLSAGMPFIKIQLLRDNPANLELAGFVSRLAELYNKPLDFRA